MNTITFRAEGTGEDHMYVGETASGIGYWVAFWDFDGWAFGALDANDQEIGYGSGYGSKQDAVAALQGILAAHTTQEHTHARRNITHSIPVRNDAVYATAG